MTHDQLIDRAMIQQRLAIAAQAGDTDRIDEYVSCFTPDCVIDMVTIQVKGRDGVRQMLEQQTTAALAPSGKMTHHLTTCRIDFESVSEAKVTTYWMLVQSGGLERTGFYRDVFRKIEGEWLIFHRRPRYLQDRSKP